MHTNELKIDIELVRKLIEEQFPQYRDLPIKKFTSMGTVNAIFLLGEKYSVRLPLIAEYADSILKEFKILQSLQSYTSLEIPLPIALGKPSQVFPHPWAIYNWIEGDHYQSSKVDDEESAAVVLANFIKKLQRIPINEKIPKTGRRPLLELNERTLVALRDSAPEIEVEKATIIWNNLVNTPPWDEHPVFIHADLLSPNLLVNDGRLTAVIDFGMSGIGDPCFDLIPAWTVFNRKGRDAFKRELNPDHIIWNRAAAYALHQAALIIPYYRQTNPAFVKTAIYTINNIIESFEF